MTYDTAGGAKLYNYFLQPILHNRDPQVEIVAQRLYQNLVELWYKPVATLLRKGRNLLADLAEPNSDSEDD